MGFEELIKDIKKVWYTLSSKDSDVIISYKGTAFGLSKPWSIKIDSREINHISHEKCAQELFNALKKELSDKVSFTENQASDLKKILNSFSN